MLLQGKNAVIYGGGGAIGGAVARTFAREGARLFLAGRTRHRVETVARDVESTGAEVEIDVLDVLDETAVQRHASAIARKAGSIDIVLNAVGFAHDQGTTIGNLALETFLLPIDRFLRAMFTTSKAVAPHMGRAGQGVILSLSAPAAKLAVGGHLGHAASQAGVEAFSRTLADELGPSNIRVVCLRSHALADAPAAGSYTGPMFEAKAAAMGLTVGDWLGGAAQMTMLKRLPTLRELAETAAFVASERAGAMTGTVTNLTCGAVAE